MTRYPIRLLLACGLGFLGSGEASGQFSPGSLAAPTASSSPSARDLVPSGVPAISPTLLPSAASGPALAPASVPGDVEASMALRSKVAAQVREGRREKAVPVPPALEIEVLDPNVNPLGNPAVLTARDAVGRTTVNIPPVVLVFRYFYTGERSFQGPMLPGGPSILVVGHPKTGERLYIETMMLPGAPRVFYTSNSIEFDYGPQSILLKFGHHGKPAVIYRQGAPLLERVHRASEARHERVDRLVERTGLPVAGQKVREGAVNVVGAGADGVRGVGKAVASPIVQLIRATPLGSVLSSDPEEKALREREQLGRRAASEARKYTGDIPTVR